MKLPTTMQTPPEQCIGAMVQPVAPVGCTDTPFISNTPPLCARMAVFSDGSWIVPPVTATLPPVTLIIGCVPGQPNRPRMPSVPFATLNPGSPLEGPVEAQ